MSQRPRSTDSRKSGRCSSNGASQVPADIRKAGGVARMADPQVIAAIIDAVTIPVMAKARIGILSRLRYLRRLRGHGR